MFFAIGYAKFLQKIFVFFAVLDQGLSKKRKITLCRHYIKRIICTQSGYIREAPETCGNGSAAAGSAAARRYRLCRIHIERDSRAATVAARQPTLLTIRVMQRCSACRTSADICRITGLEARKRGINIGIVRNGVIAALVIRKAEI